MTLFRSYAAAVALALVCNTAAADRPSVEPADKADTTAWIRYFDAWESQTPDDAQLWIDKFNYWIGRAPEECIVIDGNACPKSDQAFELQDENGNAAGALYTTTIFDDRLVDRAVEALDRGLALYPDRFDMHMGRAAAYRFADRPADAANSLRMTLDRCSINGGRWIDGHSGSAISIDMRTLVEEYVQGYVCDMLSDGSDDPEDPGQIALRRLLDREAELLPGSVVVQNNLGVLFCGYGQYDRALEHFVEAHRQTPDDIYAILNIAYVHRLCGHDEEAVGWYSRLLSSDDPTAAEQARLAINEIGRQAGAENLD